MWVESESKNIVKIIRALPPPKINRAPPKVVATKGPFSVICPEDRNRMNEWINHYMKDLPPIPPNFNLKLSRPDWSKDKDPGHSI